jgi:hypothetical protein
MFSSLRTEGVVSNHLFMPALRVVGWQDELVEIESANDPALRAAQGGQVGVPVMALRRLASDNPGLQVVGRLRGQPVTFGPGPGQTRLTALPAWQDKFLHFRAVSVGSRPFCSVS